MQEYSERVYEIQSVESPLTGLVGPWIATIDINYKSHRTAKAAGKTVTLGSITLSVANVWTNPGFGHLGHDFYIDFMDQHGNYSRLGQLAHDTSRIYPISGLFNQYQNVFGINQCKITPFTLSPTLVTDNYTFTLKMWVNYTIT